MGFQDMKEVVHKAASSKGGRVRTKKGLAAMSPEKRREVQSKGGKARYGNKSNEGAKQTQEDTGGDSPQLADILGDIDDADNRYKGQASDAE